MYKRQVETDENNKIISEQVNARFRGENILAKSDKILIGAIWSVPNAKALGPFKESFKSIPKSLKARDIKVFL